MFIHWAFEPASNGVQTRFYDGCMKHVQSIRNLLTNWDDTRRDVIVYVVPRIRYQYRRSDYLYQLYKPLMEAPGQERATTRENVSELGTSAKMKERPSVEAKQTEHPQRDQNPSDRLVHQPEQKQIVRLRSLSFWEHGQLLIKPKKKSAQIHVLHYHWFECQDLRSLFGVIWKCLCIAVFRWRGGKLVWTMHNKYPHNPSYQRINLSVRTWLAKKAARIHLHCEQIAREACETYAVDVGKICILEHPLFDVQPVASKTARERLISQKMFTFQADDTLFLMFGQISHYKNLEPVCRFFADLGDPDKHLIIAGPVKKGQQNILANIQKISGSTENIHVKADWISEEMMDLLFSAADCVILNVEEIWMSGVAKLAQSYQKPMILPELGCLPSLANPRQRERKDHAEGAASSTQHLYFFNNPEGLKYAIQQFRRPT